jgi:hypothetical protein
MYYSLTLLFSYHACLIAIYQYNPDGRELGAGWSSPVARQAHNLKVAGSNPAPATIVICTPWLSARGCLFLPTLLKKLMISLQL